MKHKLMKKTAILLSLIGVFFLMNIAFATEKTPRPVGFNQTLVFMATGAFDPANASPYPGLEGCDSGTELCDGHYFQSHIMGRNQQQIADRAQESKDYFLSRFGVDTDALLAEGRIEWVSFFINPDYEYRVHFATGLSPDKDGWIIRDGGFAILVVDPNGIELGGEFTGHRAELLNVLMYGEYSILQTHPNHPPKQQIVQYRSSEPARILDDGSMEFRSTVIHPQWGEGGLFGVTSLLPEGDNLRANARAVLTWPALSRNQVYKNTEDFDLNTDEN